LARADEGKANILGREVKGMKGEIRALIGALPYKPAFYTG
jgi:ABC-type multidrug transport system ATPase subunit